MEAAAQTILSLLLCPAAFSFLIFQPQPASENTLALLTRSSGKRIAFLRPLFLFPSGSPPFSAVTVRLELRAVHAAVDDGCDAPSSPHFPCPEYLSCRLAERTNKETTNKQTSSEIIPARGFNSDKEKETKKAGRHRQVFRPAHSTAALPVDAHCLLSVG